MFFFFNVTSIMCFVIFQLTLNYCYYSVKKMLNAHPVLHALPDFAKETIALSASYSDEKNLLTVASKK